MSKPRVTVNVEGQRLDADGRKTRLYYGTATLEGFSEVINWKQEHYRNPRQFDAAHAVASASMEADGYDGDPQEDAAAVSTWKRIKTEPKVNKAVRNVISGPLALADNMQTHAEYEARHKHGQREVDRLRAEATAEGWTITLDEKPIEQARVEEQKQREQRDISIADVLGIKEEQSQ